MDFTSAFKSEVFRPLATLVVPGFIALAPYAIIAGYYVPQIPAFWAAHDGAFVTIYAVCVLAAGLILESLGAILESRILDGSLGRRNATHQEEWEAYLKLQIKDEIIGQRYLRTVLLHLKFELSMIPALIALWIGLIWINGLYDVWTLSGIGLVSAAVIALTVYLVWESFQSASTLARTRKLILDATGERN